MEDDYDDPIETEEVLTEKASQPQQLHISSFPFAPEYMIPDKKRAIKILEEASEACEAFKSYLKEGPYSLEDILAAQEVFLDEFCDTFQALFTAAACVGVRQEHLDAAMQRCFQKNIEKGHYPDPFETSSEEPVREPIPIPEDSIFPHDPPASSATYNKPSIDEVMADARDHWDY